MTNIQAAIGLGQLKKIAKLYNKRRKVFETYNNFFLKYPSFSVPNYSKNYRQSFGCILYFYKNK